MGQTISKVRNVGLQIQRFVPVLRYKKICQELRAESHQVKALNQELKAQNQQLKIEVASFEKDKMQDSLKIQELQVESTQLKMTLESTAKAKVLNTELQVMREQISKIEQQTNGRQKCPVDLGGVGEEFVLNCLQKAYPSNNGIVRNSDHHCGDLMFRIENSNKVLMVEVKNLNSRPITRDREKFFTDLENSQYHGGILVSLNTPVDINHSELVPQLHKGKPYVYVDKLKDSRDPVYKMQVLVSMMTFMMNFATDLEHYNPQLQLNHYSRQTEELKKLFEKLTRNNTNQGKILDSIKAKLSENQSFLADDKKRISEEEQPVNFKEGQS